MAISLQSPPVSPRRIVMGLCLGSFVTVLTISTPGAFLPDMAEEFGTTVPVLGQVSSAMMLVSAVLGLILGPLADRFGHRRLIVVGLLAAVVTQLLYGLSPAFQYLFLACVWGAFAEATVPGLSLAIAGTHFSGKAARSAVGWTVASLSSSVIVGVPLLAAIGGYTTWRVAFLVASIITVAAIFLVMRWLPSDAKSLVAPPNLRDVLGSYRPLLRDRSMVALYACCATRAACWYGLLTYFGAFLHDRLGFGPPEIGLVFMAGGVGYFAGSLVAAGPLSGFPALVLLAVGNTVMGVGTGLLLTVPVGAGFTIMMFPVASFAGAIGWVGLIALLSDISAAGAGTTMVLNSSLMNLGAFTGSAIGGLMIAVGGYAGLSAGLSVFGIMSVVTIIPHRTQMSVKPG